MPKATNAIVNGQLTYGYAVGLRVDEIDGILFGPSYVDLMRMTSKPSGDITLYGVQRIQRCVLIDERQLSLEPIPVGEAKSQHESVGRNRARRIGMNRYLLIGGAGTVKSWNCATRHWTIDLHGGATGMRWWAFGKPFDLYIQQTAIISSVRINGMIRERLLDPARC